MTAASSLNPAFRFQIHSGGSDVDCIVTDDAVEALGAHRTNLSEKHRRFLEGIAIERVEWSSRPQSTIVIDAWDIATHRQDFAAR